MGDVQQRELIRSLAARMQGPILEIGSKRYGGPPTFFDYRTLFPGGTQYVGVDREPGDGVDAVIDMTSDIGSIREGLGGARFNALICLSVLEHVKNITVFASNVDSLMNRGAMMIISVPFVWEVHAFPADYWRFTPGAIEFLFPHVDFDLRLSRLHTDTGRTANLAEVGGDFNAWIKMHSASSRPGKPVQARLTRAAHSLARKILGLRKDTIPLHSTMFDMVGFKARE